MSSEISSDTLETLFSLNGGYIGQPSYRVSGMTLDITEDVCIVHFRGLLKGCGWLSCLQITSQPSLSSSSLKRGVCKDEDADVLALALRTAAFASHTSSVTS